MSDQFPNDDATQSVAVDECSQVAERGLAQECVDSTNLDVGSIQDSDTSTAVSDLKVPMTYEHQSEYGSEYSSVPRSPTTQATRSNTEEIEDEGDFDNDEDDDEDDDMASDISEGVDLQVRVLYAHH